MINELEILRITIRWYFDYSRKADSYIAKLNNYLVLHTGVNHTPIATIFGDSTDDKYIRSVERFCIGWANDLAAPT